MCLSLVRFDLWAVALICIGKPWDGVQSGEQLCFYSYLSQLLFVGVGHQITACCKQAVYKLPTIKAMVDASQVDAIFFQPSDDIREDPFVLPDVLGYLGMPDPARWAVPSDLNRLVGIVKLARCLRVDQILDHLGSVLEIAPDALRVMKTGILRKKVRNQLRCVYICLAQASSSGVHTYVCFQSECECSTEIHHCLHLIAV